MLRCPTAASVDIVGVSHGPCGAHFYRLDGPTLRLPAPGWDNCKVRRDAAMTSLPDTPPKLNPWRLSVAPMMDWVDTLEKALQINSLGEGFEAVLHQCYPEVVPK